MAATAYAALRSLLTTIAMEQTPSPLHPPFPFSAQLIEALLERIRFMLHFLEQGWKGAEHLEPLITHLAYAAEDAIEIPIVKQIRSRLGYRARDDIQMLRRIGLRLAYSSERAIGIPKFDEILSHLGSATGIPIVTKIRSRYVKVDPLFGSIAVSPDLENIIHDLDLIKAEMMLIQDMGTGMIQDMHSVGSRSSATSSTAPPQLGKMVGFEEEKSKIIGDLTCHDRLPSRQIIPIVGMGGIGKTTLARDVFDDSNIMMHFDVHAWVTVSQEYDVNDILEGVLSSITNPARAENLREQIYRSLFNRRYLVIFDDMWRTDIWHDVQQYFPDNKNGSRIIVTTRLTNLAEELSTGFMLPMTGLDEENSGNLFREKVFGEKTCPPELQEVATKIVQNCKGLPLAIVVIGGLLAKSDMTVKYWEHVVEDFHSCLYSSDDDHCSKILFLSYNHLPVHLKPCLLYLGVFPEDHEIRVSKLMKLWIAEGFLKPLGGKTLEETAEEYLKELIERNFIMVFRTRWGNFRCCIIHDLLRELCLREAQKEKFYYVLTEKSRQFKLHRGYQRRIVIGDTREKTISYSALNEALLSMSHVRTLILIIPHRHKVHVSLPIGFPSFSLLRILISLYSAKISQSLKSIPRSVNMRYLAVNSSGERYSISSICPIFRNFQMLDDAPHDETRTNIWNLVQLRKVKTLRIAVTDPLCSGKDQHVLENLQSLKTLEDFRFSEDAIMRIPNVKKLEVVMTEASREFLERMDFRSHLEQLKKLESFSFTFTGHVPVREFLQGFAFPPSLKKLSLSGCQLRWEDLTAFGSLPNLEVLKLDCRHFVGTEWNPVVGEFVRLKLLKMSNIEAGMKWNADSNHFPCLEQLHLVKSYLEEIPFDFVEISTLQLIRVDDCLSSVSMSAETISKEQQDFGDYNLVVQVYPAKGQIPERAMKKRMRKAASSISIQRHNSSHSREGTEEENEESGSALIQRHSASHDQV